MTILEEIEALRDAAEKIPVGKRRNSQILYVLLRECYLQALRLRQHPNDEKALRLKLKDRVAPGRKWTYVQDGTSVFGIMARYVFFHDGAKGDRANASRYGRTMEEAHARGMTVVDFADFLKERGGVKALHETRRTIASRGSVFVKTIHMNRAVEFPVDTPVDLRVVRRRDGSYEVLGAAIHRIRLVG